VTSHELVFAARPMLHDSVRVKVFVRRQDGTLDCVGTLHLPIVRWAELVAVLEAGARATGQLHVTLPTEGRRQ